MKHRTLSALGALALAAGAIALPLSSAPAAEAHDATATITCEGWTATATAYDQGATGVVIADGVTIHSGTFAGAGTLSGVWPEVADAHRLQVTIDSQDGDQYDFAYDETVSGCAPTPPVVVVPQVQDYLGECSAAFVLDNTGSTVAVRYDVNGRAFDVPAGTAVHTDADGSRIDPVEGRYLITTNTGQSWTFDALPCPGPQPEPLEASSQSVTDEPWECDATTTWRTIVTSTSTTPYVLVEGEWVPDRDATTMASSTQVIQRELTEDERTECATPPVIVEPPVQPEPPAVTEPPAPAPVVEPTPEAIVPVVAPEPTQPAADAPATLPETGGTPVPLVVLAALALALMLGGLIAALVGGFSARWKS